MNAARFFACVFVLVAAPAAAQTVTGLVVEAPSRRPIAKAEVRLLRVVPGDSTAAVDTTPASVAATAADGVFTLMAPGPGTYRVRFSTGTLGPPLMLASVDTVDERVYAISCASDAALLGSQVDRPVEVREMMPRYPTDLVARRVTGCAAVQFVVDTAGRAEPASLRVLAATHREFADASATGAAMARYRPAERDGRPVRSVMRVPFSFSVEGKRRPDTSSCVAAAEPGAAELVGVHVSFRQVRVSGTGP